MEYTYQVGIPENIPFESIENRKQTLRETAWLAILREVINKNPGRTIATRVSEGLRPYARHTSMFEIKILVWFIKSED